MSPGRTSPDGCLRFKRMFPGVGGIWRTSGTRSKVEFRARDALLTKLWKQARVDLLKDFKAGHVTIEALLDMDRRGTLLHESSRDAIVHRPLWEVVAALLPRMGKKPSTRARYRGTFDRLQARALLGTAPRLGDLATADWLTLRAQWPGGASDWNHVGRSCSRLLTVATGSKHSAVRLAFMQAFPMERETERRPDLTTADFHRVVATMPDWMRPTFYTLVITGMRIGEYLSCTPAHLLPQTRQVIVPGHKSLEDALPIAIGLWPWVEASIPSPVSYDTIRKYWKAGLKTAGLRHHTLHDIRHLTGQWLADAGYSDSQIAVYLRHLAPATTRRYTKQTLKARHAETMAGILGTDSLRGSGPAERHHAKRA